MSTNNNDKKRKHFNKDKMNSKRNRLEFDQGTLKLKYKIYLNISNNKNTEISSR